jgi:hypothetical protein
MKRHTSLDLQRHTGDIQRAAIADPRARILIPDNTPLSLLAMIGEDALDRLFTPGAQVWVTDMVREEALRDPDGDADRRDLHRRDIANWFLRNEERIQVQVTNEGCFTHPQV